MRKLVPARKPKRPLDPVQWVIFGRKALARAERAKDPRSSALKEALAQNRIESALRKLSLICDADLDREFPIQS